MMINKIEALRDAYDVVIVGTGPGAAAAAKALSGSGLDAVMVEKCSMPRDKMCSGMVLPSAQKFICDNFGGIPEKAIMRDRRGTKGARMFLKNDAPWFEVPMLAQDYGEDLPEYALNVHRQEFDYSLCEASGAPVADNCLFVDCRSVDRDVYVKLKHHREYKEVKARYLVGADGCQSKVRRCVAAEFERTLVRLPTYEEVYEGTVDLEPGWIHVFLDPEITPFIATVHYNDNSFEVATTVWQGQSVKEYFHKFTTLLKERFGLRIDRTEVKRGIILYHINGEQKEALGKGSVLLAGDACGLHRGPDGISTALITGYAAGRSILQSIHSGTSAFECYTNHEMIISERKACEHMQEKFFKILNRDLVATV